MSLLPSFKAIIDLNTADGDCDDMAARISCMKGVLSAQFVKNAHPPAKEIHVTYVMRGSTDEKIQDADDLRKKVCGMPGVKKIEPLI